MNGHTIGRWLSDRTSLDPERIAIECEGRRVTYGELDAASERLALGLRRGERVATLTRNSVEHVELFFACARAGACLLPLSWRLTGPELVHQLDDAEPSLFLVEPGLEGLAAETGHPFHRLGEPWPGARHRDTAPEDVADSDPLLLVYTSGTTGRPKGALLTHANCFWTNLSLDLGTEIRADDVVLQVLPQCHVGGWNVQPLLAWWKGATVILEPAYDPARCLELIESRRVTAMMGVPATYLFMAQEPGFAGADLSSLRLTLVGGAPLPESIVEAWRARGVEIVEGYGLTEAAPNVLRRGKPYPHVEVEISEERELLVRGPNVFAGYWRNPAATEAAFRDGWLLTGDVAERDEEGRYLIRGRLKDMYISGGENVYPAEVEAVLHEHPDVADAAVVGMPDGRWGEAGLAAVVLAPGARAGEDELVAHCRGRLARYKVPRAIRFVDELPRSSASKVLKGELRARLETEVPA